jgi:predicted nucleic acid-binding protein
VVDRATRGEQITIRRSGKAVAELRRYRILRSRRKLCWTAGAGRAFAGVAASLRRSGRKTTARAYDAMIAATAIANDLPVYTCGPSDFSGIDGSGSSMFACPKPLEPAAWTLSR